MCVLTLHNDPSDFISSTTSCHPSCPSNAPADAAELQLPLASKPAAGKDALASSRPEGARTAGAGDARTVTERTN